MPNSYVSYHQVARIVTEPITSDELHGTPYVRRHLRIVFDDGWHAELTLYGAEAANLEIREAIPTVLRKDND